MQRLRLKNTFVNMFLIHFFFLQTSNSVVYHKMQCLNCTWSSRLSVNTNWVMNVSSKAKCQLCCCFFLFMESKLNRSSFSLEFFWDWQWAIIECHKVPVLLLAARCIDKTLGKMFITLILFLAGVSGGCYDVFVFFFYVFVSVPNNNVVIIFSFFQSQGIKLNKIQWK